jgi:hypothetical protein
MIYIVDIDNTICITPEINGHRDYTNAKPMHDRIEKINKLKLNGHKIIYWTARGSGSGINWFEYTLKQLVKWNCLFDELRMGKPSYDIWIDDKAINDKDFFNALG